MLAEAAERLNKKIKVHIKIDTGMNRLGFSVQNDEEKIASIEKIKELSFEKNLEFEGIFTHFAVADEPEDPFTRIVIRHIYLQLIVRKGKHLTM